MEFEVSIDVKGSFKGQELVYQPTWTLNTPFQSRELVHKPTST